MAVAFPVGVGLSIIIGVVLSYAITPLNDPILLFGGVLVLIAAIVVDAKAYRAHGEESTAKRTKTGIVLCIVSGIGLGLFYPLVAKSFSSPSPLGAYSVGVIFMLGMLLSNLIVNTAVMIRPVTGRPPLTFSDYTAMPLRWHLLGFLMGGAVWGVGSVFNFVASGSALLHRTASSPAHPGRRRPCLRKRLREERRGDLELQGLPAGARIGLEPRTIQLRARAEEALLRFLPHHLRHGSRRHGTFGQIPRVRRALHAQREGKARPPPRDDPDSEKLNCDLLSSADAQSKRGSARYLQARHCRMKRLEIQ